MSYHEYDIVLRPPVPCPICGQDIVKFESCSGFCRFLRVSEKQLYEDYKRNFEGLPEPEDGCWYYGDCNVCNKARVIFEWTGKKFIRYINSDGKDYIDRSEIWR